MNKWMDKFSDTLQPIAIKIGNQKFLIALRNAFVGTMPVIMTGSIAILLNAFFVDFPMQFGFEWITPYFQWLVNINNLIFGASIAIVSLIFIFSLGVNVAKIYKVDELSSGIVSFAAFIITITKQVTQTITLNNTAGVNLTELFADTGVAIDGNDIMVQIGNVIPGGYIDTKGYFTAIIIGFVASIIFSKLMLKNWTIKLPDSVPPAIATPFLSIIPGFVALYVVGIFTYVFNLVTDSNMIDWIYKVLQAPLLGLSQNLISILVIAVLVQLFWFFGLHGGNVMAPIMEGTFGVALLANLEAYKAGEAIPYIWTTATYGAFIFNGTI